MASAPTLLDAARTVLNAQRKPMRVTDIWKEIESQKLWASTGKTPAATLYSELLRTTLGHNIGSSRRTKSFYKADPSTFGLVEWLTPDQRSALQFEEAQTASPQAGEDTTGLPTEPPPRVWLEIYNGEHDHGGEGWRDRLWSPDKDRGGADRYAAMRDVQPGDLVLHAEGGIVTGFSFAAAGHKVSSTLPPKPGPWSFAKNVYSVELRDRQPLESAVDLRALQRTFRKEIMAELRVDEPKYYPFYIRGEATRITQGLYLAACTPKLYRLILRAMEQVTPFDAATALVDRFIEVEEFSTYVSEFRRKKNLIMQGPPGVGKTYLARTLAHALIGSDDPYRVAFVQFHQSYSYEDFVQGWRPAAGGGFQRRNGVFYEFCSRAAEDTTRQPFVFIIDEINRGNLSKIFGELLMLIERDKRGRDFGIPLTYSEPDGDEEFSVPENVHVLGLMNTADRSLAVVDYALRRRFGFIDLVPKYEHPKFREHLLTRGVDAGLAGRIIDRMSALNKQIRGDNRLGPGFEIGHSFFCDPPEEEHDEWYRSVVTRELEPLLREYWFDDLDAHRAATNKLLQ